MVAVNGAFYDVLPQLTQLMLIVRHGVHGLVTVQYEKGPELTVLRGIGESEGVQPASDEGLPLAAWRKGSSLAS